MLSFFSKIKNRIGDIITKRRYQKRLRNYQVVVGETIMTANISEDDSIYDESSPPPPPSPVVTTRLFNTEIDETIIKNDYELLELLKMLELSKIDITNVTLEKRFETMVNSLAHVSDVFKIKMKLLYIIIANDMYRNIFEEKKHYTSFKVIQNVGVFRFNDYIIRIDDCPFSFMNETVVTTEVSTMETDNPSIIRPFLIYMNIRKNCMTNDTCDCRTPKCDCSYTDNAEYEYKIMNTTNYTTTDTNKEQPPCDIARSCFEKLRNNTISFSIQYYAKDTVSLYTWVKENLATDIYNQFSAIQRTFFIHLFYQCALLLRDIHRVSIVHGDIKPDNILIREHTNFNINHPERCKNFTVYLIDFGLSGLHKVGFGTGGTIPYCHPEFKNITDKTGSGSAKYNWKKIDVKHDVWSLGISFLTIYVYRDFYSYYHKYPNYFFIKNGYVSSLIMDVITDTKIHELFTKILSEDCISSIEVCELLQEIA
jgi:hypothetical protein